MRESTERLLEKLVSRLEDLEWRVASLEQDNRRLRDEMYGDGR